MLPTQFIDESYNNSSKTIIQWKPIEIVLFCLLGILCDYLKCVFYLRKKKFFEWLIKWDRQNIALMNENDIKSQRHEASGTQMLSNTNIQNTILVVFCCVCCCCCCEAHSFLCYFFPYGKRNWVLALFIYFFTSLAQYRHFMKHTAIMFISFSDANTFVSKNKHTYNVCFSVTMLKIVYSKH